MKILTRSIPSPPASPEGAQLERATGQTGPNVANPGGKIGREIATGGDKPDKPVEFESRPKPLSAQDLASSGQKFESAPSWDRTKNLLIKSQLLCRLS